MTNHCRLCGQHEAIKHSHVIPAFVVRYLKRDSPTGHFRNPISPNKRVQDSDKLPLLCKACEGRFAEWERDFAERVYLPFITSDQDHFAYGPWMHRFLISLAWRTLVLELPEFAENPEVPPHLQDRFLRASIRMGDYLLGERSTIPDVKQHMQLFTHLTSCSPDMAALGPNVLVRRSTFGYTMFSKRYGYAAVLHNLAGLLCVCIIKGNPRDVWEHTRIVEGDGEIRQPQHVDSWVMGEFMEQLRRMRESLNANMSDRQVDSIRHAVRGKSVDSLRFWERDTALQSDS